MNFHSELIKRVFILFFTFLWGFQLLYAQRPDGEGVSYGEHPSETLDYWQAAEPDNPIVVLVPGENWNEIDINKQEWQDAAQLFYQQGYAVVGVNYVSVSDSNYEGYPHQLRNLRCALAWTKEQAAILNGDPDKIILFGGATGAHLASLYHLKKENSEETVCNQTAEGKVLGVIGLAGLYDFDVTPKNATRSAIMDMLVDSAAYWKPAQPIEQVANAEGAHFLLLHGTSDGVVGNLQPQVFYDALWEAGAYPEMEIYQGKNHHLMTDLLNQDNSIAQRVLSYADSLSRGLKGSKVTALSSRAQGNSIQVYPSPASGHFFVNFGKHFVGTAELVLVSMEGKEYLHYHEQKAFSTLKVGIEGCPPGVYVLHVQAGSYNFRQRVIIH